MQVYNYAVKTVLLVTGTPPWVVRIDEIKTRLSVNVEAEIKVNQLTEEMQSLARSLRTKDQAFQESNVKIELMERRMGAVKRQADQIADLEIELGKARKQERAYEEAMEQLQADLDELEQANTKLKAMAPISDPDKQIMLGAQHAESDPTPMDNLEASHLLEMVRDTYLCFIYSTLSIINFCTRLDLFAALCDTFDLRTLI